MATKKQTTNNPTKGTLKPEIEGKKVYDRDQLTEVATQILKTGSSVKDSIAKAKELIDAIEAEFAEPTED